MNYLSLEVFLYGDLIMQLTKKKKSRKQFLRILIYINIK